jgi:nitroreductase
MILRRGTDAPPSPAEVDYCYQCQVEDVYAALQHARLSPSSGAFSALESYVDELRRDLRASVLALTRERIWTIVRRLRAGQPLSQEHHTLIRMWVIGDAEAYVREEQNYPDWVAELERLESEIEKMRSAPVQAERLRALEALLTDAHGVILNVASYLTAKERVEHFEKTMANALDHESRNMLADILVSSFEARL